MPPNVQSDGKTVTVTSDEGHRIGFAMAELDTASTAGEITTAWAGGVAPDDPEAAVRAAKAEAEAHVAEHDPEKPDSARETKERDKGVGAALKSFIGLP